MKFSLSVLYLAATAAAYPRGRPYGRSLVRRDTAGYTIVVGDFVNCTVSVKALDNALVTFSGGDGMGLASIANNTYYTLVGSAANIANISTLNATEVDTAQPYWDMMSAEGETFINNLNDRFDMFQQANLCGGVYGALNDLQNASITFFSAVVNKWPAERKDFGSLIINNTINGFEQAKSFWAPCAATQTITTTAATATATGSMASVTTMPTTAANATATVASTTASATAATTSKPATAGASLNEVSAGALGLAVAVAAVLL